MKFHPRISGIALLSILLWTSMAMAAENKSTESQPAAGAPTSVQESPQDTPDVIEGDQPDVQPRSQPAVASPPQEAPSTERSGSTTDQDHAPVQSPQIAANPKAGDGTPLTQAPNARQQAMPDTIAVNQGSTGPALGKGTGAANQLRDDARRDDARNERVQYFEQEFRSLMTNSGVNEFEVQNAILVYIQEDAQARLPLKRLGARLLEALRNNVSDAELTTVFDAYRAAIDADKARRDAAQAALDAQIGYGVKPRLESMLMLFGLIGDGPALIPLSQPPQRKKARTGSSAVKMVDHKRLPTFGQLQAFLEGVDQEIVEDVTIGKLQNIWRQFDKDRNGEVDPQEKIAAVDFLTQDFQASHNKTIVVSAPPASLPAGTSSYLPISGGESNR